RSAQVVDRVEVPDDVLRLRRLLHLALAGHQEVEVDDVPRRDDCDGLPAVVPVVVGPARIDGVLGAHRSAHATARTGHPVSPGLRAGSAAKRTRCPLILSRFVSPSMMYTSFWSRIPCAGHGGGFGVGFSPQPSSYQPMWTWSGDAGSIPTACAPRSTSHWAASGVRYVCRMRSPGLASWKPE